MRLFKHLGAIGLVCLEAGIGASPYQFYPWNYIPANGANWNGGTSWQTSPPASPPVFGTPTASDSTIVSSDLANGNYNLVTNGACPVASFSIPSAPNSISFTLSGNADLDDSPLGELQLFPSGGDGLYFSNSPINPSSSGDSLMQVYTIYINFQQSGNIHNSMLSFTDDYGQYITSSLDMTKCYIYGANTSNVTLIADDTTYTNIDSSVIGRDANGNNPLQSLSFMGNGSFEGTDSSFGPGLSQVTVSSNLTLTDSLLASGAGNLILNNASITSYGISVIGPAVVSMQSSFLENNNFFSVGSFTGTGFALSNSNFISGTILGNGTIAFASNATVSILASQDFYYVGRGFGTDGQLYNLPITLTLNGTLYGQMQIASSTLTGLGGVVIGPVPNLGGYISADQINIGGSDATSGVLTISGPIIQIGGYLASGASNLIIQGGQITSDGTSTIGPSPLQGSGDLSTDGLMTIGLYQAGAFTNGTSLYTGPIKGAGRLFIASSGTFTGNITQNTITLGQGYTPSSSLIQGTCTVQLDGAFNGTVINGSSALLIGSGRISGPILQNFGAINPNQLIFSSSYQTGALDIIATPVVSSGGTIGYDALKIQFLNGTLNQSTTSFAGFGAQAFVMAQGQIISDSSSYLGPSVWLMQGGSITNNGTMVVGDLNGASYQPSSSSFEGGAITGNGQVLIAGNLQLEQTEVSQSTLVVGQGITPALSIINTPATVTLNTIVNAAVINGTLGVLDGSDGVIIGTLTNYGLIDPVVFNIGTTTQTDSAIGLSDQYVFNNYGVVATNQLNILSGTVATFNSSILGSQATKINMLGGYVQMNDDSDFGASAASINLSGGLVILQGLSNSLAYEAGSFNLSGGSITGNNTSFIGPCPFNQTAGSLVTSGSMSIGLIQNGAIADSQSSLSGGSFSVLGNLYNASDLKVLIDATLGSVTNGMIYIPSVGLTAASGTISINASVTANLTNEDNGVVIGQGGILSGTINNLGGGINPQNLYFDTTLHQNGLTLNVPSLINAEGGKIGYGSSNIQIIVGSISNQAATFGGNNPTQVIQMSGGYVENLGAFATTQAGVFNISGGTFINGSMMGPVAMNMQAGVFQNNGSVFVANVGPSTSVIQGGSFSGSGNLYILGQAQNSTEFSQGFVYVNSSSGISKLEQTSQVLLINNGTINATLTLGPSGLMCGTGVVNGESLIQGELSLGPIFGKNGTMSFIGELTLDGGSQTDFWMGPNYQISRLNVDGTLSVLSGPATLFVEKQTQTQYTGEHIFPAVITYDAGSVSVSDFSLQSYYKAVLLPGAISNTFDLKVDFSSLQPYLYPGNAGVVARNLSNLQGNCSLDLEDDIDVILRLDYQAQENALLELCPQFKLIQYSLEKLIFTQEDYYSRKVNEFKKGFNPFLDAGFDQYAQKSYQKPGYGFNSYHINSFVQNIGFTYGTDKGNMLMGLGAIESYFKFLNYPARARYKTLLGAFGYAGKYKGFEAGLDVLGSYTAIKSRRNIELFELVAKNKHNAWNASGTFDAGYRFKAKHFSFKPYDKVGYIFGKERHDKESGANVLDLVMNTETISMLRNTLGMISDFKSKHVFAYIDLAYVYETIFSDLRYKGRFVNTSGVMNFYAIDQNHNFFKSALGLGFSAQGFEINFSYQALMAHKFLEQTGQVSLGKKF